jgi:peroxiredoxin
VPAVIRSRSRYASHRKYEPRGVAVVSITPDARENAEDFVRAFGVERPCIYAAPRETFEALGAFNPSDGNVMPTLYVVGRDGTVAWHDHAARYRHEEVRVAVEELQRTLDEALPVR